MTPPEFAPPGGFDVFVPYSWFHAVVVALCAIAIAMPSLFGRTLDKNGERMLRRALAASALVFWVAYNAWWNRNGVDLRTGLPLQICDLNGLIAPYALLTGRRWARATLYFFTFTLTLQAFIQPELTSGPANLVFWAFWTGHSLIAASTVYDLAVLGFRPGWGDLVRALAAGFVYVAAILPLDLWLRADYGFIGNPPPDLKIPPFVDALGPWPQRAVVVVAMAVVGFVVVLLPWRLLAARHPTAAPGGLEPRRQ